MLKNYFLLVFKYPLDYFVIFKVLLKIKALVPLCPPPLFTLSLTEALVMLLQNPLTPSPRRLRP
jgi:hypothetical protein